MESVVAAVVVEGDEFVDPGFGNAVVVGDGSDAAFFDDDGVDEEPGLVHGNPLLGGCPLCPETCCPLCREPEHPLAHTVRSRLIVDKVTPRVANSYFYRGFRRGV